VGQQPTGDTEVLVEPDSRVVHHVPHVDTRVQGRDN
jgi:hypothetical protein